jgi:hypothetical protein
MANRRTIHVLRHSIIPSQSLPTTGIQIGEPLLNTGDGILFFSGTTSGSPTWVPSDNNPNYFEVGSNLYNLKLRNQITTYQGISGAGLVGKFLSGTTSGFVLADISNIVGSPDSYVTGATWTPNTLSLTLNQGKPNVTVSIDSFNGITLYGTNTVNGNLTVTGTTQTKDLNVTGFVLGNLIPNTGCTYDLGSSTNRWDDAWVRRLRVGTCTTTLEDDTTQFIITVDGTSSGMTVNLNGGDLNVSGDLLPTSNMSYNIGSPSMMWNNIYGSNLSTSALTVTNLSPGKVVYIGSSNELKTETGFEYDDVNNRLTVGAITVNNITGVTSYIGQGGLVIGSGGSSNIAGIGDLTVHGNLFVFGTGSTIATSELYIEDPQITLNYNPSGSSTVTSVGSGIRIQDGSGIVNSDVYLTIAQMNTFTGGNASEYSGPTGYGNRAFLTQLNDIVLRNTNLNNGAPDGVRVLAEFDILDGGTY